MEPLPPETFGIRAVVSSFTPLSVHSVAVAVAVVVVVVAGAVDVDTPIVVSGAILGLVSVAGDVTVVTVVVFCVAFDIHVVAGGGEALGIGAIAVAQTDAFGVFRRCRRSS